MLLNITKKEKEAISACLRDAGNTVLAAKVERSMRQIKPKSCKGKGRAFQLEICRAISDITGVDFDQQDDTCDIHSREMSLPGADIVLRGKAKERFGFSVECKACTKISLPDWVRQAAYNCGDADNWLLCIKSPVIEGKKVAVLPLEAFVGIMKENQKAKNYE